MSEMTDNERLLMNVMTAIQKGLRSGHLDISDIALLQAHLDNEIDTQIRERAEELGKSYTDNLNAYMLEQTEMMKQKIQYQQRRINELDDELELTRKDIDAVKLPHWVVLAKTSIATIGGIVAALFAFLLTTKSLTIIYEWMWQLPFWNWLIYLLIIVITFGLFLGILALYIWCFEAVLLMNEKMSKWRK